MISESIPLNVLLYVLIFVGILIALYLFYTLLSFIYLFAVCLTCSRNKKYTKFSKYYYHVYLFGARLICRCCRIKIHVDGKERLPDDQKFLLVSNHLSNWDNIVQAIAFSKTPLAYISKSENFKIPFVGRLVNRCLFLSINRGNLRDGLETILHGAEVVKNQQMSLAVFPEGTRSKDGNLGRFKPGCLKIVEKSKCPMVIVATRNTNIVHKNMPLKRTHVYIDVVDVLTSEQVSGKKTVELSEIAHKKIADFLEGTEKNCTL